MGVEHVVAVDAFDLPDWLGERPVVWTTETTIGNPQVPGALLSGDDSLSCDLLACDRAHPAPVIPEAWRREAHSAWAMGQVLILSLDDRLTLVTPGVTVSVDAALESLRRLARAVGARPSSYSALVRL